MADPTKLWNNGNGNQAEVLKLLKEKFGEMTDSMISKMGLDPQGADLAKIIFDGIMDGYLEYQRENKVLKEKLTSIKLSVMNYQEDVSAEVHRDENEFLEELIQKCQF